MNVDDALEQITQIHRRMASGLTFRGYTSSMTTATGLLAINAAVVQSWLCPAAAFRMDVYLFIWLAAAMLGLAVVGAGVLMRVLRRGERIEWTLATSAFESIAPCIAVGALSTYAIARFHGTLDAVALLPGLWMILFAMGIFASSRLLPRSTFVSASFYLLSGCYVLTLPREFALSPGTMGVVFGVGQLMTALLLRLTLERDHEQA